MLASRPRIAAASRAWFYLLLLLVAAGLILSVSLGALIAAACAVFVWLVFQRPSIHSVLALATLTACVVALLTLQSIRGAPDPLERFETATSTSSQAGVVQVGSVHQRIGTYRVAIERIEENPFVGVGLDLFSITRPFGIEAYEYDVHNLVIRPLVQDRALRARRNAACPVCDPAIWMDRDLGVDLDERAETRRRSRQLGRCLRRLCDDRSRSSSRGSGGSQQHSCSPFAAYSKRGWHPSRPRALKSPGDRLQPWRGRDVPPDHRLPEGNPGPSTLSAHRCQCIVSPPSGSL